MIMTPGFRKFMLTAHVVCSVGWVGALAAFLVLSVAGLISDHAETVRASYVASGLITGFVIVPFALGSLLTGIIEALGTQWGLFRHYWVIFKLAIAVTATLMLLLKTGPISDIADLAAETALSVSDLRGLKFSLAGHAVGGLLILLWAAALAVYKPRGATRCGRRKRQEPPAAPSTVGDRTELR